MLRTHYAKDLTPGLEAKIAGFVHEKRDIGKILFLMIRDFSGVIQITAKKDSVDDKLFDSLSKLRKESSVLVAGKIVSSKNSPNGIELIPDSLVVLAESESILPIDMTKAETTNLDKRLDFRCLDLRRWQNQAIFKVQSALIQEMQSFLHKKGFLQVFTPCLMGVASESGSDVFSVVYYDKEAFLRQDPQLHRQLAIAGGLEKIYDVGPSWRAEVSHTTRHLCEHRTCAVEIAFIQDEFDVMKLEQDLIIHTFHELKKECKKELELFGVSIDVPKEFPVLQFPGIYDILKELGEKPARGKESYGTDGERLLGEYVKKKFDSDFFFVNRFPFAEKPFYVMKNDDTYARSTDMIYRGVELSSGGQREHRHDKIIEQAKIKGMNLESVEWFANFFKYGVPPHGGFAIGIERLTKQILGIQNIREAVLFPRDVERLVP